VIWTFVTAGVLPRHMAQQFSKINSPEQDMWRTRHPNLPPSLPSTVLKVAKLNDKDTNVLERKNQIFNLIK
jgi:predicted DNA-binding helix-hairpin-helix protein